MIHRLQRKVKEVLRFYRLASGLRARLELLLLGMAHSRLVSYKVAACLCGRVITPALQIANGGRVRIDCGDTSQIDCFIEIFVDRIYDLTAVPFAPDLILDCGAYHGYFSTLANGRFPGTRLVALEANPSNLTALQANLAHLSHPVEVIFAAAHTKDGQVFFAGSGMGGSIATKGVVVPAIDLAAWLVAAQVQRLVLKLDVEGAEVDLLPTLLPALPQQTAFFLETHHSTALCEHLLAPYRQSGFKVCEVRRRPAAERGCAYIEWMLLRA